MQKAGFSSVYEIYKLTLEFAGERAGSFKKSLLCFFAAFVSQGLALGMFYPLLTGLFAGDIIVPDVLTWLGLMIFFSIISLAVKWKAHDFDYTGNIVDITHSLRTRLGIRLRMMPLQKLSSCKTGELNSIFSSNVDESVLLMGMVAGVLMQLFVVPAAIIAVTFCVDFRLALLMLLFFPFAIPLYYRARKLGIHEKSEFNRANAELEAGFIEYIQGLPVLRAVNRTGINAEKLQQAIGHVRAVQKQDLYKLQLPFVMLGILIETLLLVILFAGAMFVDAGSMEPVTLGACLVIVARLTEPLSIFIGIIQLFDLMDSAFKRIRSILETESLEVHKPVQRPDKFDIVFKGVSFTYDNQRSKAIENMSFYMPEKTMTAIAGHSGCGKTTLTRLIMRYADIQQGSIRIGGADIKNMNPDDLMKYISVVFQDVYLFDDTIMNNIKMANPDATDKEVEDAAQSAYCHEFISSLPDGYNTKTGDIGGNLSGGEKQRISIARAILKNAPIVILDEPTAALDTESEAAVQNAVSRLVEDKTVIVIAHRLSTIAGADNILIMDNGRIIESGKHDELINKRSRYFDMWSAQQRDKEWQIAD
ncbi:MAG: ABC transporter ATP-binding protein [Desulfobacteraceae bacterium]|jgi:ATP-binding cassette subfamily B protein